MIHTVRPGDTLSALALAHLGDLSRWPEIARANLLADPNLIRVGQQLQIPDDGSAADASASLAASSWGGAWVLDLPPGWWLSSSYEWRGPWPHLNVGRHFHTGIDIALSSGTPLPALAAGVVAEVALSASAGRLAGYGGVVRVDTPDGRSYFYAHCRKVLVKPGQTVSAGQILAESGGGAADPHRGLTDGAHLHLETWDANEDHFNPLSVLQIRDLATRAA